MYGKNRHFNFVWFENYKWLEFSVKYEAAFCFGCYLFKGKSNGGPKGDAFVKGGWKNWYRPDALDKHVGGINSIHNKAQEKYNLFVAPQPSIDNIMVRVCKEDLRMYKARLTYSLRCLRFLLNQGLAFRGHDESEESSNRGNFLELLKWLSKNDEEVNKHVLNNAPGNCILTSPKIQNQIIEYSAAHTTKRIIEDIGADHYAILADESNDASHKEQLALCIRFVDKSGRGCERFLGVVHVANTTSLSLKDAIQTLLKDHHLTHSQIRGQGYDGASNMKGEVKGLKTLIMKESPFAYYIHCFAHELQLVLIAVAKDNEPCLWFFDHVSYFLNIVGVSCKRHDMLRDVRAQKVLEALEMGEIESGSGLNQEMGLARPGDTCWGSHFKTIMHIVSMYSTILEVLDAIGKDPSQKSEWTRIRGFAQAFESFDFVFNLHLMLVILGYTNELSKSLQKRDQDIVNAMTVVSLAKSRMQHMRSHGWEEFLAKLTLFCNKHDIEVPLWEDIYEPNQRSRQYYEVQTNDHRYRREVYLGVIDQTIQELDNRFDEVNTELLICMSALNPLNSFASYDALKVMRLAEFYPMDISSTDLIRLEFQLTNFIDDMRQDDRFRNASNIGELSIMLVATKKHVLYDLVYLLIKLILILPVATASVERVFSAMNLVKNKLRTTMSDDRLNDCLVTFIERDVFMEVSEDDIVDAFMAMQKRRVT
ncbi:zinc finger MYM-type protein 1 isoform X2 [Triticum aestivum]|uniref:zinc finger MYM-type protein 1 isoform X1 n=1 Tax=Triticum aestivum TaxID=4565 RepID=UPI000845926A|nr:zinc finger MYM-type protein 1-like isoform X1 [Triticum aestivum]XP_044365283.1 zinc finger MYM-type protein 1-like isoform X2 [Triticum aestivum]